VLPVDAEARHAVIGSLVQAVRAATAHERAAVERTLAAQAHAVRTAVSPVEVRGEAERALNDAVNHLLNVTAAYPSIVASREVAELREQLASADDRLALARRTYNHAVRNTPTITEAISAPVAWRLRLPPPPDPFEPDSLPG
jgi:LemA protein